MSNAFPAGVAVFFRLMTPDGNLARSIHPRGRDVEVNSRLTFADDYVVVDEEGNFLASFPRDFVAAILPLETTGPGAGNAPNQPQSSVN